MKKYELTKDSIVFNGETLFRIKALRDFGKVKKGDLGGFVASEENLSHNRGAWVSGTAWVSGNAWISGDARVFENARVSGDARVFENARVSGDARVSDDVRVSGDARIYGDARVSGDVRVSGDARIYGDAEVFGDARVSGKARVYGGARVSGDARIYGDAEVTTEVLNIFNERLYQFNITFTDYHVQIGCKQFLAPEVLDFSIEDAKGLGLDKKYFKPLQRLLKVLVPEYLGKKLVT